MKTCKILLPLKGAFVQNVLQIKVSLFSLVRQLDLYRSPLPVKHEGTNQLPLRGKRQELQQKSKANMNNGNEMQI